MPSPSHNLLDELDALLAEHGGADELTVAPPYRIDPDADVAIVVRRRGPQAREAMQATLGALAGDPGSAAVTRRGRTLRVRFADERLAALGAALEAWAPDALPTDDLAAGADWVIDFCNPNATKALHVGHLRNLAVGQALAGMAEAAGARVVRQSQVGDCGRSMGEALAGYRLHGHGRTPASSGAKGDHLVGECYARYVADLDREAAPVEHSTDSALAREAGRYGDLADSLMARWLDGDREVVEGWRVLRDWAVEGQDATLARLGIVMDRTLFESDYAEETAALAREALARGTARREPSGALVYPTGRPEYPLLLLTRSDGLPTQHLRYLAVWRALRPLLGGTRAVGVGGDEWLPMVSHGEELLRRLDPGADVHPATTVLHGMVTAGEDVVKSSAGTAALVDELLDTLAASAEIGALRRENERADPRRLAAIVALGFCLGRPAGKRLAVSRDALLHARTSSGWALAEAWARAWSPRHDGDPDPEPDDPSYRLLLLQSQLHRRLLAVALERLDSFPLARFHTHLSQWYLAAPADARLARAVRTVLGSGLAALGLLPATGDAGRPEAIVAASACVAGES